MLRDAAKRIVMAARMLHGACVGEEAGARNRAFFPCKVAAAGNERYLRGSCGCGRFERNGFLLCVLQRVVVPVCVVLCAFLEPVVADRIGIAA